LQNLLIKLMIIDENEKLGELSPKIRRRKVKFGYRVAVIGGGSWATAIVKILSTNLKHIHWWVREPEIEEGINNFGHNPLYLSSVEINPRDVKVTTNIKRAIAKADYVVIVTPSAFLFNTMSSLSKAHLRKKKIITAVKGIVPETNQLITDFLKEQFDIPLQNMALISGPSHAEEIAQERFTFLTAASPNQDLAEVVAKLFTNRYVRTSVSLDLMGIELAVVLKNIYALGAGIYNGLGFGDNFLAGYIANCVKEMKNFVNHLYPDDQRRISESVYLGDLLVTCYSQYSRNRMFGKMIGQGFTPKSAQLEMKMIAEGFYACRCIHEINKQYNDTIPIVETIYGILYEGNQVSPEMKRIAEHFV